MRNAFMMVMVVVMVGYGVVMEMRVRKLRREVDYLRHGVRSLSVDMDRVQGTGILGVR